MTFERVGMIGLALWTVAAVWALAKLAAAWRVSRREDRERRARILDACAERRAFEVEATRGLASVPVAHDRGFPEWRQS